MNDVKGRVSSGAVSRELGISAEWVRVLTDQGIFKAERTNGGHRRYDLDATRAAWVRHRIAQAGIDGTDASLLRVPEAKPVAEWTGPIEGAEEDVLWREVVAPVLMDDSAGVVPIARYVFTEMLNNAIDHSGGTKATVMVWQTDVSLIMEISDDGIGVFRRLAEGKGLPDLFASVEQLSKGKQTTAPDKHSGEGIFFSSKAVDLFRLSANGIAWTVDNVREDVAVGVSLVTIGTRVHMELDPSTDLELIEVYRRFTDENHHFNRTRPTVKLFGLGVTFVSRSEAKRLATSLEQFDEVELDFTGVQEVGQAFVDELFRVWAASHPDTKLIPTNMNAAVDFMVNRGLPRSE
jgi:hypothetical protein